MKISKGLKQAYALQDFTFEAGMSLKASLTGEDGKMKIAREDAQSIAAIVKSWESCQQRIQVHRRVPNPGSLKHAVEKQKPKRRSHLTWPRACPVEPREKPVETKWELKEIGPGHWQQVVIKSPETAADAPVAPQTVTTALPGQG